jgi:formamidopyrimidine-DNA glycosylase
MGKTRPIKTVLLDQEIIAGVGNIYSDEILWKTGVHPLSSANKVPETKLSEIYKEMKRILKFSIGKGGDSKSDYRNIFGEKGGFQNFHKAYGNKGKKCPRNKCSGIIERIMVKTRSSHFCPVHQKLFK